MRFPFLPISSARVFQVAIKEGSYGDSFYVIVSGTMKVTQSHNGTQMELNVLGQKDFVGEMSLMFNQPCVATVCALPDAAGGGGDSDRVWWGCLHCLIPPPPMLC